MAKHFFHLKADFFPFTVFKLVEYDRNGLEDQLKETIQKAPQFLKRAPMVIDVQNIANTSEKLDLPELYQTLRSLEIFPVGIRGLPDTFIEQANAIGLAIIQPSTSTISTKSTDPQDGSDKAKEKNFTKIITKPIRAGMRVYAPDGDLIIAAPVNAGAECIATGHIHIYGSLRGRALAGASGNNQAKIFCHQVDAELISIAGHYILDVSKKKVDPSSSAIQISLENETLKIEEI